MHVARGAPSNSTGRSVDLRCLKREHWAAAQHSCELTAPLRVLVVFIIVLVAMGSLWSLRSSTKSPELQRVDAHDDGRLPEEEYRRMREERKRQQDASHDQGNELTEASASESAAGGGMPGSGQAHDHDHRASDDDSPSSDAVANLGPKTGNVGQERRLSGPR